MSPAATKIAATGVPQKETNSVTPGRPKDSGSRQQTHPGQALNSGSPSFDKETTERTDPDPVPVTPPDTK
jgi:hypothetical protein